MKSKEIGKPGSSEKKTGRRTASHKATERQLHTLLFLLIHQRTVSSQQIRKHLESKGLIDEDLNEKSQLRAVQRDLQQFSEHMGSYVEQSKDGWRWNRLQTGADLVHMSLEMALSLKLFEGFATALVPGSQLRLLRPLFDAANKLLKKDSQRKYAAWLSKIRIMGTGFVLLPPPLPPLVLERITESLRENLKVKVTYESPKRGEKSEKILSPLGVAMRGGVLYLAAIRNNSESNTLDDVRNYALHRIKTIEVLSETFAYPSWFNLDKYINGGALNIVFEPQSIEVEIRLTRQAGAHLLESKIALSQEVIAQDSNFISLRATVPNTIEFRWWIMAICDECEVVSPLWLRQEMHQRAKNGAELNS